MWLRSLFDYGQRNAINFLGQQLVEHPATAALFATAAPLVTTGSMLKDAGGTARSAAVGHVLLRARQLGVWVPAAQQAPPQQQQQQQGRVGGWNQQAARDNRLLGSIELVSSTLYAGSWKAIVAT